MSFLSQYLFPITSQGIPMVEVGEGAGGELSGFASWLGHLSAVCNLEKVPRPLCAPVSSDGT